MFFTLNPSLMPDCSNIQPQTSYCVKGDIEPVTAWDGLCGPLHHNATCLGTDAQCCNAETWTCGNTDEDCAPGTCYEGYCYGDKVYSTDGTCGEQHGDRECVGKWGNCCNQAGRCGTGSDFCGRQVCYSGDCDWKLDWNPNLPTVTGNTTNTIGAAPSSSGTASTSQSRSTTVAPPAPTVSDCVKGTGQGGYSGLCDFSCYYGFCPAPCSCTSRGATANTPPALTGDHGYAVAGLPADFGPLCDFTCSHNYCPSDVCRTTPPATTSVPGSHDVCVQGVGAGGYTGLCSFCCHYGFCPPSPCTCTLYGTQIPPPPETGTPGKQAPGTSEDYASLCSFACNHGYCPPGACVFV